MLHRLPIGNNGGGGGGGGGGDGSGKAIPLYRPLGIQEAEAPRFHDNRHMKAVWLSPAALTPRKYSWYSFLLEAESTTW